MPHKLIVGITESGKSTLARAIEQEYAKYGIPAIIYDPTLNPQWNSERVTSDEDEFFRMIHAEYTAAIEDDRPPQMLVIVDEADTLLSMAHRRNWWLFQRGRHFGIEAVAITQRPTLIAPTIRGNVTDLYLFRLCKSDAAALSEDFGSVGLALAHDLPQGAFMRCYWKDKKKVVDYSRVF